MATDRAILEALRAGPARFVFEAGRSGAHRLVGRWGRARPAQLHVLAGQGLVAEEDVLDGGTRTLTYRLTALGRQHIGIRPARAEARHRRPRALCRCGCGRAVNDPDDEWSLDVGGGLRCDCAERPKAG